MDAFPAYFPLKGKTVAIAGTGDLAEAKARLFAASPAQVRRLMGPDALGRAAYQGCSLAFIADPDEAFCAAAACAAREAGVPVNVTDRPALSDFATPAIIDRGEVVAAVGTGGASPMLAAALRGEIEARLPEGVGRIAALLHKLRDEIREARPDLAERRDFLRAALDGSAAEAALAGRMAEAEALLRQTMAQPKAERKGWIRIVDGHAPVDLLTLRAARALAEADVLAVEDGVRPEVMARARRDAPHIGVEPVTLARRVANGEHVVCITCDPIGLTLKLQSIGLEV